MFRTLSTRYRNDRTLASFHLLDVVQVLGKYGVVGCNEHRGQVWTDQRNDSVFQLRARVSFGKEIRDFLHLERPFERDREIKLPTKEKHAAGIDIFSGNCLNLVAEI